MITPEVLNAFGRYIEKSANGTYHPSYYLEQHQGDIGKYREGKTSFGDLKKKIGPSVAARKAGAIKMEKEWHEKEKARSGRKLTFGKRAKRTVGLGAVGAGLGAAAGGAAGSLFRKSKAGAIIGGAALGVMGAAEGIAKKKYRTVKPGEWKKTRRGIEDASKVTRKSVKQWYEE